MRRAVAVRSDLRRARTVAPMPLPSPHTDPRAFLRALYDSAVARAQPQVVMGAHLPPPPKGRTVVIGGGKASGAMVAALDALWPADAPLEGLVLTRYHHTPPAYKAKPGRIELREASHPVPDEAGLRGAADMMARVRGLTADDLVIALVSGGGSALLSLPAEGIGFADEQAINRALLESGAVIGEMNCVRKHLSAIKGGRLAAAAYPARVLTLVISDVPNDDLSVIASGPTVPDSTTFAEARAILAKYGITSPAAVIEHLERAQDETPKPGDPRLARAETVMIATPQMSLEAAAEVARTAGVTPLILGDAIEGEAREVGKVMAGIARQAALRGQPARPPCVLISGGETTVTVRGGGRGGRNVEFLLSLAVELDGLPGIFAVAGDTDGVDGAEEVAGALITPDTLARAAQKGVRAKERLADNDGHGFFEALDDQIVTGPTLTNVNDFRAILIAGPEAAATAAE
jgi:glycerate 2-kinase